MTRTGLICRPSSPEWRYPANPLILTHLAGRYELRPRLGWFFWVRLRDGLYNRLVLLVLVEIESAAQELVMI
jgi:hypothetical protein